MKKWAVFSLILPGGCFSEKHINRLSQLLEKRSVIARTDTRYKYEYIAIEKAKFLRRHIYHIR